MDRRNNAGAAAAAANDETTARSSPQCARPSRMRRSRSVRRQSPLSSRSRLCTAFALALAASSVSLPLLLLCRGDDGVSLSVMRFPFAQGFSYGPAAGVGFTAPSAVVPAFGISSHGASMRLTLRGSEYLSPRRSSRPAVGVVAKSASRGWEGADVQQSRGGTATTMRVVVAAPLSTRNSLFFPPGSRVGSPRTRMSATGGDGEVSSSGGGGGDQLSSAWLRLRRFFAAFWKLLVARPSRYLKSILERRDGAVDEDENGVSEENQDGIIPTQIENIAVNEELAAETVAEPKGDVPSVPVDEVTEEAEKGKEDKDEAVQVSADTPAVVATPSLETTTVLDRSSVSSASIDLTGNWTLIVDDEFRTQYDEYLRQLGQPLFVRTVAMTAIGSTREETRQSEGGRELYIRGTNVRGSWDRTLEASERGSSSQEEGEETSRSPEEVEGHALRPMTTADDENVSVASWWEDGGSVHRSWVVGGKKYGGGDFENRRYLANRGNVLVCESTFHPNDEKREKVCVTWRFLKEGAIYGDAAVPNLFKNVFGAEEAKKELKLVEKEEALPTPPLVVGDILDESVAFAREVDETAGGGLVTGATLEPLSASDMIEAEIERESWVPPLGERWAITAPGVDLTGKWKLIISEQFNTDYESFLKSLGQPLIVRGTAVILVGNTREETTQSDGGRSLHIKGINAKGVWERTLVASGSDAGSSLLPGPDGSYEHARVPIVTADSEHLDAESWWERGGTTHVSWTLNVTKYGGGAFESRRYLENDGDVYVCESTFHPKNSKGREPSYLKWKFLREGATLFVGS